MALSLLKDKYNQIPSLQDLCINVIQSNLSRYNCLQGISQENVNKILQHCSPDELERVQKINEDDYNLILQTDDLWKNLCHRDFKTSNNLEDYKKDSWEEVYFDKKQEREIKIKSISKDLKKQKDKDQRVEKAKETKTISVVGGNIKSKTIIKKIIPPSKNPAVKIDKPKAITKEVVREKREEKSKPLFKEKSIVKEKKQKLIYAQKVEKPKPSLENFTIEKRKIDLSRHETPKNIITAPESPVDDVDDSPLIESDLSKKLMKQVKKQQKKFFIPKEKEEKKKKKENPEPVRKFLAPEPVQMKPKIPSIPKKVVNEEKKNVPEKRKEDSILSSMKIPKKQKLD